MPSAPDRSNPRNAVRVAIPVNTVLLLALATSMLGVFLIGVFAQSPENALAGFQPTPTNTTQPVLTVAPETGSTPIATATSAPSSIRNPMPTVLPTATATAITTPTALPTPVPTVPVGGG
jgi:septal ring-binding cell division protein DamX